MSVSAAARLDSSPHVLVLVSYKLKSFVEFFGERGAYFILPLIIFTMLDVFGRKLTGSAFDVQLWLVENVSPMFQSTMLQEMEWHIFSFIFLLGAAYTLKHDDHVRLDLFYQSRFMNDYRRAWVNLFGSIFMLLPFCILIIYCAWPFVNLSYISVENSPDPGGLPYRWILKAVIPAGFALLLLQGISEILKNLGYILENRK